MSATTTRKKTPTKLIILTKRMATPRAFDVDARASFPSRYQCRAVSHCESVVRRVVLIVARPVQVGNRRAFPVARPVDTARRGAVVSPTERCVVVLTFLVGVVVLGVRHVVDATVLSRRRRRRRNPATRFRSLCRSRSASMIRTQEQTQQKHQQQQQQLFSPFLMQSRSMTALRRTRDESDDVTSMMTTTMTPARAWPARAGGGASDVVDDMSNEAADSGRRDESAALERSGALDFDGAIGEQVVASVGAAVAFGADGAQSAHYAHAIDYFRYDATQERRLAGGDMPQRRVVERAFARSLLACDDSFVRARLFAEVCDKRQLELRPVRGRLSSFVVARLAPSALTAGE